MSFSTNPTQKSPERAFALQKYLLLHSQHDALQKHLDQITPSYPETAVSSPSHSPDRYRQVSLSSSPGSGSDEGSGFLELTPPPTFRHHARSGSAQSPSTSSTRRRRFSLPTVFDVDEKVVGEIEKEENKLKNVNQQIKSTLTDLLNCDSVKSDRKYRMWIQSRLMDAEQELKKTRSLSADRRRNEDMGGVI